MPDASERRDGDSNHSGPPRAVASSLGSSAPPKRLYAIRSDRIGSNRIDELSAQLPANCARRSDQWGEQLQLHPGLSLSPA